MPFSRKEKKFCVLKYAQTQLNKTVQHTFVRKFAKNAPTAIQIETYHKKFFSKLFIKSTYL